MKEKKDSMLSFRVTEEERHRLKELAARERKTFKQLFFEALEKTFPTWNAEK